MKKMKTSDKRKLMLLAAAALILALIVIGVSSAVRAISKKKAEKQAGYSFSTSGFKDVKNAECLNESVCVFTDSSGKKGLMTLDGEVTEKAGDYEFRIVSDEWLKTKIVATSPKFEYPLTVDETTGKIGKRQYNKADTPEKTAYWNEELAALCWYGADGYIDRVSAADISGLGKMFPAAQSDEPGAKYGYVNDSLRVAIDFSYDRACKFSEGLAAVSQAGSWGYINESGGIEIPFEFDPMGETAYSFRDGLVAVSKDAKYGILDRRGRVAVEFEFDKILQGKDGKYIANKDGKWGILTINEDIVAKANTTTEPQTEANPNNYTVSTNGGTLNLREQANTSARIVTEIPNGAEIYVITVENGWASVRYGTYSGFVSANYIKPKE